MNAAAILYTPERNLRAPFRILIFLLVMVATLVLAAWLELAVEGIAEGRGYTLLVSEWSVPIGILAATWLMLRAVDARGWRYVGLDRHAARPSVLAVGSALGLVAIAVPSVVLLLTGQLDAVPSVPGSWLAAAGLSLVNLFPAAFGEELLMRGYIFSALRDAVGAKWTLISTSVVFGLLHIPNPGADAQSIMIVMMAGFFLGTIYIATRSLWAATMAHFVWNWFMAAGLHTPVSGLPTQSPDYRVVDSGPDWLTGGAWGPEGGLPAALGMFAVLIYLQARQHGRTEPME